MSEKVVATAYKIDNSFKCVHKKFVSLNTYIEWKHFAMQIDGYNEKAHTSAFDLNERIF